MKIIPAIDLRDGRVVRLRQGDFDRSRQFDHEPQTLAARYAGAGAQWLHLVDLDGARAGRPVQVALLQRIAAGEVQVQAGGGVRSRDDVARLLDAGIARVVVGSVAVRDPDTFAGWLDAFGPDRLCLALDLLRDSDGRWRPAVDAWQATGDADIAVLLDDLAERGLRHVLSTDIAHDGMGEGPNLVLYRMLAGRWPQLDWIASGGVRHRADVDALRGTGVAACVAGTALLDGSLALEEIAACSRTA
ncbi:HisA/HisF-related TIM barrel protein [Dokdonella koreensis]|uniref:1-(5-phosphoribosyl)-5-[(5-phosphoribosylamino)methylideneamino] imidazole-4-carboxamide isomerase n=1 Tax=Dokdonella koreensis DS-123 TaxID=1300342 RepID=A0A160DXM0_9GAMM|nr:1-(5-phosphoribosyl)-5-[(5-phosphoribosylamino)methylideneamino] imidazole-4-carboxamide isomerase [Dokdonella koreensis]ANB19467.1 1-(5-phosphoribosyl)-5-[(5- phosphoribosylamino)methylideneamino] imidazole-4-carboxamide isomerase [Dokdonella koreensis DS-123]